MSAGRDQGGALGISSSTSEAARAVIGRRLGVLAEEVAALRRRDDDRRVRAERVHGLRVATRRASAALLVFRTCIDEQAWRNSRRRLRRLRRAAAAPRACDVHIAELRRRAEECPELQAQALGLLVRVLRRDRRQAEKRLASVIDRYGRRRLDRWRRDVDRAIASSGVPGRGPEPGAAPVLLSVARRVFPRIVDRLEASARGGLSQIVQLHELRLAGKRVRYAAEVLAPCDEAGVRSLLPLLSELQDRLGKINDAAERVELAERALEVVALDKDGAYEHSAMMIEALRELRGVFADERDEARRQFAQWWHQGQGAQVVAVARGVFAAPQSAERPAVVIEGTASAFLSAGASQSGPPGVRS